MMILSENDFLEEPLEVERIKAEIEAILSIN
jgi:hypothetical protein